LHPVEKSLWKILWTISKTDDMMSSCTVWAADSVTN
jgi:hypothetical protein